MSEVPPPYNRSYSFTDFSTYTPNLQQPGNKIDQELNNVRTSLNATIDRLSEIQRDDGKLDSTSLDFNDIFTGLSTQLSLTYAAINSPVFTGSPEAPTPLTSDNSTKIATTEFVKLQDYATQDQLNSIQSSLSNYLTLSGGTLTGTLSVNDGEGSYANVQSSVIYVQQTNAGTGQSNAYGYMWNGGIELGDTAGKWTELTPDHIRFGDGTIQTTAATAGAFLPLAGGTMTGDIVFPADANNNDLQIGPWGLGVENTNGKVAYIQPDVFRIYDNDHLTGTSLNGEGITFNDSTKQVTAGLPITGGTLTGTLNFSWFNDEFYVPYASISKDGFSITPTGTGNAGTFSVTNWATISGTDGDNFPYHLDAGSVGGTYDGTSWSIGTSGVTYPDASVQSTAGLPLTGGIMSGAIRFDSVGTQNISKGSFDSGRGGYNGISLVCAVDYELNWQAGYLKALNSGGFTVPVNFDSSIVLSDDVFGSNDSKSISANAIDGDSYSGFELTNGGSAYGADLKIKFGNTGENYENQAILTQSGLLFKEAIGNTTFASYGASGITFSDNSIQQTAFIPANYAALAGATFTGKVNLNPAGTTTAPLNLKTGITPSAPSPGDIWIATDSFNYRNSSGVTRTVATLANNNPFTNYQSISVSNNSNPALKITQLGTGEALRVEDETSPDATAFVVSNNGRVGIGIAPDATVALTVDSTGIKVNGATLIPAAAVSNPPVTSGNMAHSEYLKELVITINGVNYAIPLRVV